jgi:ATP/maltotriose-dependent transcriptional regulator MalT
MEERRRPIANAAFSSPDRVPLVGRREQLDRLEAEINEAGAGRLRIVLLVGDAGVGKTRLAAELVARHRDEVIPLSARAYPLGATASLGLWVEALERHLRSLSDEDLLDLCGGHVEDLASLLPSVRAAARARPNGEYPRIRLLGALATLLQRLAERSTVVVTLDDIHLGDGSSWEALNYLSRNLADSRMLILVAARPNELREHAVAGDVVRALAQEGLLTRVRVDPLTPDDVRDLAAELLQAPAGDGLVDWLVERAEGTPLFVIGLVRALVEEGADLARPSLRSLPEDLAERVQARLRNLDAGARATLELLTVLGCRAELGYLLRVTGQSLDDMAPTLERLQRVRLVGEIEEGRELLYEIVHPLIQEAIYGQIGGARRRALHRHAARVLVEAGSHGAAASHVVQAADPGDDEAIDMLCEALRRAGAGEHHREALALLEALLFMIPAGDRRWRKVVDVMPLTPEWVVDHRADARAGIGVMAMQRADQVLERTGDISRRAAVKFSLGSLLAWGTCDLEQGRELLQAARELFVEAGDGESRLLATNELSYHLGMADDGPGHEKVAREVLWEASTAGDEFLSLQATCSLAWALTLSGRHQEALSAINQGIALAERCDRVYRRSYLHGMRASVQHLLGDRRAPAELETARSLNPAYRDTLILDFTAQLAWECGDLQAAVAAALDQMAWDGAISTRRAFGIGMAVMSLAEMGRADEAADLQATLDGAFRGTSCWILSRLADWSRSVAAGLSTSRASARDALAKVAEDALANNYWSWGRWMLADLAEWAAYARDGDAAKRSHDLLASDPWAPAGAPHEALRSFVAGAAAAAAGAPDRAATALEHSASRFHEAEWRLWEARALALLGSSLARVDRTQAVEALEQAIAGFDECGAVVRRQEALSVLTGLGSRGRRKRAYLIGPAALSSREREVARLAVQGLLAREIAEQLFIGERTVETHLANVYRKLGVASKLDLVRRADEIGI